MYEIDNIELFLFSRVKHWILFDAVWILFDAVWTFCNNLVSCKDCVVAVDVHVTSDHNEIFLFDTELSLRVHNEEKLQRLKFFFNRH